MHLDATFWFLLVCNASLGLLVPVGLLGIRRYRELPEELRFLVGLIWFEILMEATAIGVRRLGMSNLILTPLDVAGELWLVALVYDRSLRSVTFSRIRPWVVGGVALYAALSMGINFETTRFRPTLQVFESLLILGMAGLYFRKILNDLVVTNLARDPIFWVSAGLVLYSVSKLLIALFSNYMLSHYSQQLNLWMWTINGLMTDILYLCYLRALWLSPRK